MTMTDQELAELRASNKARLVKIQKDIKEMGQQLRELAHQDAAMIARLPKSMTNLEAAKAEARDFAQAGKPWYVYQEGRFFWVVMEKKPDEKPLYTARPKPYRHRCVCICGHEHFEPVKPKNKGKKKRAGATADRMLRVV